MKAIFLDIETNGLDFYINSPIQICVIIYDLHTMVCICEYQSFVFCSERQFFMHSDHSALNVNSITYEDLKNAKTTNEICEELTHLFVSHDINKKNSIFICQNPSFDRGFFDQIIPIDIQKEIELPYHWLDLASMYWGRIFYSNPIDDNIPPLSKDNIALNLGIPPEKKPHRAMDGVKHLISCYRALFGV